LIIHDADPFMMKIITTDCTQDTKLVSEQWCHYNPVLISTLVMLEEGGQEGCNYDCRVYKARNRLMLADGIAII
jgi:hypothetical protein